MAYRITKVYFFMLNIGDHVSAEGLLYISYRSAIWKSGAMERWPLNMMGFGFNPVSFTSCAILHNFLNVLKPLFLHLKTGDNNSTSKVVMEIE